MGELKKAIGRFVKENFTDYVLKISKDSVGSRYIRDIIWGSSKFQAYEVAIIDSPLMQRLRDIKQLGATALTYNNCNHTRFEHSIGVAIAAGKIIESLTKRQEEAEPDDPVKVLSISEREKARIRIAALLHDVGHGPFSHASEAVYGFKKDFLDEYSSYIDKGLPEVKPHEFLSYLIVTCPAMKRALRHIRLNLAPDLPLEKLSIGDCIVGYHRKKDTAYQTDIINGHIDADKIDYILRDAYYSGLSLPLDVTRLFETIDIVKSKNNRSKSSNDWLRLCINHSGLTVIEQIIFSRMMLQTSVYDQHTVLASHSMLREILNLQKKLASRSSRNPKVQENCDSWEKLNSAIDFLRISDRDILMNCNMLPLSDDGDHKRKRLVENLNNRILPKRAYMVSLHTIDYPSEEKAVIEKYWKTLSRHDDLTKRMSMLIDPGEDQKKMLLNLKDELHKQAKQTYRIVQGANISVRKFMDNVTGQSSYAAEFCNDIRNELSNNPNLNVRSIDVFVSINFYKEPKISSVIVKLPPEGSSSLENYFPMSSWCSCYTSKSWNVFIYSNGEYCADVFLATSKVLRSSKYNVYMNDEEIKEICKVH